MSNINNFIPKVLYVVKYMTSNEIKALLRIKKKGAIPMVVGDEDPSQDEHVNNEN